MAHSHAVLRFMRTIHLYLGVFIAPALLFFAFTGAVQSINLHETTQGSSYQPPRWIMILAQLHKKQNTNLPVRKPRDKNPDSGMKDPGLKDSGSKEPGSKDSGGKKKPKASEPDAAADTAPDSTPKAPESPAPPPKRHMPMKIFFVLVSTGLFISTLTGIYMAYRYQRSKLLITLLLAAGIVVPLLLLPF